MTDIGTITQRPTRGDVYSPVAEAERHLVEHAREARLAEASRILQGGPGAWLKAVLDRASAEAVARHLDGALHILRADGWAQNVMRDRDGGVCLFKALSVAAERGYGEASGEPGRPFEATTHYVAGAFLDLMAWVRTGGPTWYLGWNDEPGRTAGEALELVEDAAVFARRWN